MGGGDNGQVRREGSESVADAVRTGKGTRLETPDAVGADLQVCPRTWTDLEVRPHGYCDFTVIRKL